MLGKCINMLQNIVADTFTISNHLLLPTPSIKYYILHYHISDNIKSHLIYLSNLFLYPTDTVYKMLLFNFLQYFNTDLSENMRNFNTFSPLSVSEYNKRAKIRYYLSGISIIEKLDCNTFFLLQCISGLSEYSQLCSEYSIFLYYIWCLNVRDTLSRFYLILKCIKDNQYEKLEKIQITIDKKKPDKSKIIICNLKDCLNDFIKEVCEWVIRFYYSLNKLYNTTILDCLFQILNDVLI